MNFGVLNISKSVDEVLGHRGVHISLLEILLTCDDLAGKSRPLREA